MTLLEDTPAIKATKPACYGAEALIARYPGIENDVKSIGEWVNGTMPALHFWSGLEPAAIFEKAVQEILASYDEFSSDRRRANRIRRLRRSSRATWPVFIEGDDPNHFIIEGRHRVVAFLVRRMTKIRGGTITNNT